MKSVLKTMQTRKYGISEDTISIFEDIVRTCDRAECEDKFIEAMNGHLTSEQRFRIWERNGGCQGKGYDGQRRAFAAEHADKPLSERLELFARTFGRNAVLNGGNTITVRFACRHGYYKHAPEGRFRFPAPVELYFERCAGGRLYELQKALGIKLKIKAVDVSPLSESIVNPVVFTFEIVE